MIEEFTTGSPYKNTNVITAEIESEFARARRLRGPGSILLQSSLHVRGTTPNGGVEWVVFKCSTRNRRRDLKCPSTRRIRMVRKYIGGP
ncbi:hypothetical protein TNCV_4249871 [Trichonephila clavipes]|nr:hypothetical protein TNCV_4249871 [Trichonephila clavipes]